MFRILNTIICKAHWVYVIHNIALEIVKKFNLLKPTLSCVRYDDPHGSLAPKIDFERGQTLENNFLLKTAIEGASLISGASSFHSERQWISKLDCNLSVLTLIHPQIDVILQ